MSRRHRGGLALVAAILAVAAPAGRAQAPGLEVVSFVVRATAFGVTARESSVGTLPAGTDIVVASSSFAETELTAISASSLAALPYPTDQVLSAPGAAAGLGSIPAPPGYPLAARADHPFTPGASATPEGQPGATVSAHTEERLAVAVADGPAAAAPSDGLGLPPEAGKIVLSVAQVRTRSESRRANDGSLRVSATTQMSDLQLLDGAFRAANVTSTASIVVRDGRAEPGPGEVSISGATLAGSPVEVTDDGLVLGSQAVPLAPIATATDEALQAAGIDLALAPSTSEVDGAKGRVTSGSLRLRMAADARGFPFVFEIDLGSAEASTEAVLDVTEAADGGADPSLGPSPLDPRFGSADLPVAAPMPGAPSSGGPAAAGTPQSSLVPTAALGLDFRPVYGWLGLLGLAILVARHLVLKATPHTPGPTLNDLRRW